MIYIKVSAPNDRNGNPRRCFVVIDQEGRLVEVIDEGYVGVSAVTKRWPNIKQSIQVNVTVNEYKKFIKVGLSDS